MTREWLDKRVKAWRRLNELRRLRSSYHIMDAAYDWLSGEIAQIEREIYGRELS
ncbi:hypothetical protein [Paenibacillus dendritiformis]|uniref:hypothetical protein n=1 Tax=Paenibacillus dendritiformis TaxID=130049 RepID=UPI0015EB2938|nr:hypothetical protein [Paenibacillus dendritiformis]